MERIGIVGLSLQETDLAGLERLRRPGPEGLERFAHELADELGASETVVLATCNRVEVVFARETGHLPTPNDRELVATHLGLAAGEPLRAQLHFHAGAEAARHLFRVASSLDSVVLGEDQILAQMRAAFAQCERAGLVGRLLGTLFDHAFQTGKRVRTETELARIPVSVVSLALQAVRERRGPEARIALVGAGEVAAHVVASACDLGLAIALVANRSLARATELAARCAARALPLEALVEGDERLDALLSATSAPGYVLRADDLRRLAARAPRGLLAIDLAVPRDLEPLADPRLELVDMEALRRSAAANRQERARAAEEAERLVEERLALFVRKSGARLLAETLAELRDESEHVLERELAQLFTGRLERLGPEERRAIEHWARTAFGRVSHVSLSTLKRLANDRTLFGAPSPEGAP